jgi:hypothetical protein
MCGGGWSSNKEGAARRARWETLVCARSDGDAGPIALKLRESTRLAGQLSWA